MAKYGKICHMWQYTCKCNPKRMAFEPSIIQRSNYCYGARYLSSTRCLADNVWFCARVQYHEGFSGYINLRRPYRLHQGYVRRELTYIFGEYLLLNGYKWGRIIGTRIVGIHHGNGEERLVSHYQCEEWHSFGLVWDRPDLQYVDVILLWYDINLSRWM